MILFNTNPAILKKLDKKQYLLEVDIKSQMRDINGELVLLYIPIFKTG